MVEPRDPLTYAIIGAAIDVHRELGPGLLESTYEEFLCSELLDHGLTTRRQCAVPAVYKGKKVDIGFRADLIVNEQVIIELKCVQRLERVHEALILTYMKLASMRTGLLMNFHSQPLIDGIKRFVL